MICRSLFRSVAAFALSLSALSGAEAASFTVLKVDGDSPIVTQPGLGGLVTGFVYEQALGSYAGSNGKQWSGRFMHGTGDNEMLSFAITNIAAHDAISIDFMLGLLDSWDSTNGSPAPDYLDLFIEGNLVARLTSNQASGSVADYGGGTLVTTGQIDNNQVFSDVLLDMSTASYLTFAHTASTLNFSIQAGGAGWQGGSDEGWGIDDIRITAFINEQNSVPEPAGLALVAVGLLAAGVSGRRRS